MGLFFLAPLALVFAISFASRGTYGGIVWEFTAANYLDLWHPLYGRILGQSLWYASLTTAICFSLGFPLAYMIARSPARWQPLLLLLVMLGDLLTGMEEHLLLLDGASDQRCLTGKVKVLAHRLLGGRTIPKGVVVAFVGIVVELVA